MAYTEEQIGYLRDALARYRDMEGRNLRPLPWKSVLDRILMADATRHEYPEDGSLPEFKEEALRRFASGTSVLSEDKLDDLRTFFTAEGYLQTRDMEAAGWSLPAALALSALFARKALPEGHLDALNGEYEAVFQPEAGPDWVRTCHDLTITPVEGTPVAKVTRGTITFPHEVSDIAAAKRQKAHKIHRSTGYCAGDALSGIMLIVRDDIIEKAELINITRLVPGTKTNGAGEFEAEVTVPRELEEVSALQETPARAALARRLVFTRSKTEGVGHG